LTAARIELRQENHSGRNGKGRPERPESDRDRCGSGTAGAFADRLADRQNLMIPAEDPDYGDLGQAFPPWPTRAREAILQPPKPEIQPSPRILERALDHDLDMEAAD